MTWIRIYYRNGLSTAVKSDGGSSRHANVQCRYANRQHCPTVMVTVFSGVIIIIIIIIIIIVVIIIHCNWVVTRWQRLFYMYTKHETGYY